MEHLEYKMNQIDAVYQSAKSNTRFPFEQHIEFPWSSSKVSAKENIALKRLTISAQSIRRKLTVSEGEVNTEQSGHRQNVERALESCVKSVLHRNVRFSGKSDLVQDVQTTDDESCNNDRSLHFLRTNICKNM